MFIPPGYGLGLFSNTEAEEREKGVCLCNGCAFIGLACFGDERNSLTFNEICLFGFSHVYKVNMKQPQAASQLSNRANQHKNKVLYHILYVL